MTMREFIGVVMPIGTPSPHSGRVFSEKVIEEAIKDFKVNAVPMFGTIGNDNMNEMIAIDKISHEVVDLKISEGKLIGHIKVLDTPVGNVLQGLLGELDFIDNFYLSAAGTGKVDKDKNVTDFTFLHLNICANVKEPDE